MNADPRPAAFVIGSPFVKANIQRKFLALRAKAFGAARRKIKSLVSGWGNYSKDFPSRRESRVFSIPE